MQKALRKECTFLRASLLYPINRNKICPIPGGLFKVEVELHQSSPKVISVSTCIFYLLQWKMKSYRHQVP